MNLALVNWGLVGLLAGMAFIASLVGHGLLGSKVFGAVLAAIIFAALLVFWSYYPHNLYTAVPGITLPKI